RTSSSNWGFRPPRPSPFFIKQVKLNRGLPFEVRIPNAVTQRTFAETDAGEDIVRCENPEDMFARLDI
ncbi:type II toxin-antitoxin system RelB/DinJ family antitoxin, partial [Candidatus Amarolinea dominans]|uniref:type II toxin-antitoxin system RelB/DinJ family antitoxin n=1 Tax=Candidatus Amarolinea dominans TaxID=3140696 RepID=UPI0031CC68FB